MRRPTVSLLVMVAARPEPVNVTLELLRPLVDEIVVTGPDDDTLHTLREHADRRIRIDLGPQNRHLGWLLHELSCDWVLFVDHDEVPSTALLDALPELARDRRVTHHLLARRWLLGGTREYVLSHPWTPDRATRMARNVPGVWELPGVLHEPFGAIGERSLPEAPLYHCTNVMLDLATRRAKRDDYERRRPGLHHDGFPINFMHTPEDVPGLQLAPVPADDQRLLERFLAGTTPRDGIPARGPVEVGTLAARDHFSRTRDAGAGAHRGRTRFVHPPRALRAGGLTHLEIEVVNEGDEPWDAGGLTPPGFFASYWWCDESGARHHEGPRSALPTAVAPGTARRVTLAVRAPADAGCWRLQPALVHEHVTWFAEGEAVPVEVLAAATERPVDAADLGRFDVWTYPVAEP